MIRAIAFLSIFLFAAPSAIGADVITGRASVIDGEASASKRGIWQGEFVAPWDWRRGKRLQTEQRDQVSPTSSQKPSACQIKGNISRNRRIYHVPGGQYYGRTRIDTSKGERWVCSEAEAQAAGWRRSRR